MDFIRLERDGGICTLTIDRPASMNAITSRVIAELLEALDLLEADPDIRALIVTGAGEKAFVAGADVAEMKAMSAAEAERFIAAGGRAMNRIADFGLPVIAAINGYALGGGCELALACDIRIASENAKLGLPETGLGIIPGFGGTQRLASLVGRGKAMRLILTGELVSAQEALALGMVEGVVPPGELRAKTRALAGAIAAKAPYAVRMAKEAVNHHFSGVAEGTRHEAALVVKCFSTADAQEGMEAFLQKRAPAFRGA